jgi:hypothetical protein
MKNCKHIFYCDGGSCQHCGKTASDLMNEDKPLSISQKLKIKFKTFLHFKI